MRGASSAVSVIQARSTLDRPVPQHGERSLACCEVRWTASAALSFLLHAACAANPSCIFPAFPSAIPAGKIFLNSQDVYARFAAKLLAYRSLARVMDCFAEFAGRLRRRLSALWRMGFIRTGCGNCCIC